MARVLKQTEGGVTWLELLLDETICGRTGMDRKRNGCAGRRSERIFKRKAKIMNC